MQTPSGVDESTLNEAKFLEAVGTGYQALTEQEQAAIAAIYERVPTVTQMYEGGLEALTTTTYDHNMQSREAWLHICRALQAGRKLTEGHAWGRFIRAAFGPGKTTRWANDMLTTYELFTDTPLELWPRSTLKELKASGVNFEATVEWATEQAAKGVRPCRETIRGKVKEIDAARLKALGSADKVKASLSNLTKVSKGKVEAFVGPIQPIDNERVTLAEAKPAPPEQPKPMTGAAQDASTTVDTIQRLIEPSGYLSVARGDPRVNPEDVKAATAALSRIQRALEAPLKVVV